MNAIIDTRGKEIFKVFPRLLETLIMDNTTNRSLIWASKNYIKQGPGYGEKDHIRISLITGRLSNVIKPRIIKSKIDQRKRSRDMAEVFTPSWICNSQNNLIDQAWFGYNCAFNIEKSHTWEPTATVIFPEGKSWKEYVKDVRLEITCGEAPYLVSRYDTVSGDLIEIAKRIGLLDRKLRVINENVSTEQEWIEWVETAFKSVYGYDFQGDNVLIARENLLFTYIDYYTSRFDSYPSESQLQNIANIISWNIWQMDGLKYVVPFSCKSDPAFQQSLQLVFETEELCDTEKIVDQVFCQGCKTGDNSRHNGKYSYIMDWEKNKKIKFTSLLKGNY